MNTCSQCGKEIIYCNCRPCNVKVGDRVKLTVKFLRSIQDISAESANQRGTITAIKHIYGDKYLAKVKWDFEDEVKGCIASNLMLADKPDHY